MLFQRLYNWIKYKTLPPSVLFKNRLFIERDSKHKRVFNNFGLVFRNSKWSNYEMYNIKFNFKWSFSLLVFSIALIFLIFLSFYGWYDSKLLNYTFNAVAFFFWSGLDSFDYYASFLIWVFFVTSSMLSNSISSYFFFNNFTNKRDTPFVKNSFFNDSRVIKKFNDTRISKHDQKWMVYSWLNEATIKEISDQSLEFIFDQKINKSHWDRTNDFFIKLYKVVYFCNLTKPNYSLTGLRLNLYKINNSNVINKNSVYGLDSTLILNKYAALMIHYFLQTQKNYFSTNLNRAPSVSYLRSSECWEISDHVAKFSNHLLQKKGPYYLSNFTLNRNLFSTANEDFLIDFSNSIYLQTKAAKWNRWLYRYSTLHRKLFKNSHKLTLSKRLLGSGFYTNSLYTHNIWGAADIKKNLINEKSLPLFYKTMYGNFFYKQGQGMHQSYPSSNILNYETFFKNLEKSYFWNIKRFYNYNSLSSNLIKSAPVSSINSLYNLNPNINNDYEFFLSNLTKSYTYSLKSFSTTELFNDLVYINSTILGSGYVGKDIVVENNVLTLLTQENLSSLYWLSSGSSTGTAYTTYLGYSSNSYIPSHALSKNIKYVKTNEQLSFKNLDYIFIKSSLNQDNIFLSDLVSLLLLKK